MTKAFRLNGDLDVEALGRALDAIVARHEALRTTFHEAGEEPVQVVGVPRPVDSSGSISPACPLMRGRRPSPIVSPRRRAGRSISRAT